MVAIKTVQMSADAGGEEDYLRAIRRQQAYAELLGQNAEKAGGGKVHGNGLGLAKVGASMLGGLWGRQADDKEKADEAAANELGASAIGRLYGGGADTVSGGDTSAPVDETGDGGKARGMAYQRAMDPIESGGNYAAVGPVTKTGDRAYGRHQVMGANIPKWTREVLGRELTPQQYLADKGAQDQVFRAKFGQYAQKYGPEGAARAWFAGEKGMHNPNARDVNGMTVANYGKRFMQGMGQGAPASPTSTVSGSEGTPAMAGGAGGSGTDMSAQELQALYRNPRTRAMAIQVINMKLAERAEGRAQQQELAKESRAEARDLRKQELERSPLPAATAAQKIEIAQAGRTQSQVNIDQKGETEEAKTRGKDLAGRLGKIAEDGDQAGLDLMTLQRLQQLSQTVEPGAKTALMEEIRQRTGIQLDPNADNVQAFQAAIAKIIPNMRPAGSGGNSDKDMALFSQAAPSLMGTPGGNELVMQTLGGLAQYRTARGDIAKRYEYGDISAKQAHEEMEKLGDPFATFKQYQTQSKAQAPAPAPADDLVRILTPEAAAKLPPGKRFRDPQGNIRMVPPREGPQSFAPSASPYTAYPVAGVRG